MLVLKRSRSLYMRNHQSTQRFSLKLVWNSSSTSVKIGTHMCVLHAKPSDLFVSKALWHRSLTAGTFMKNQSQFVWKRMPKIKPLRASYQLITDTELCFSAEVNRDNGWEISPDICISNWLLPKKALWQWSKTGFSWSSQPKENISICKFIYMSLMFWNPPFLKVTVQTKVKSWKSYWTDLIATITLKKRLRRSFKWSG